MLGTRVKIDLALLLGACATIYAAPTISTPVVSPATLTVNQAATITASCQINSSAGDPAVLEGGVNLVRLTATGAPVSVVGVMQDGGNGSYTLQFTDTEPTVGSFQVQCTAAFAGLLQRIKSPPATVMVVSNSSIGSIGTVTLAPSSIPYGIATSVTITAPVFGGTPDAGSVMLQRLDSSGRVLAILGTMHDDGLNGDPVANDGNYTLVTTFTEFAAGPVSLRVSATFSGAVNHALSPIAILTVQPAVNPPPTVTITTPANLSYLNITPTTVTGTVSDPPAKVVINSINAPVANGTFTPRFRSLRDRTSSLQRRHRPAARRGPRASRPRSTPLRRTLRSRRQPTSS